MGKIKCFALFFAEKIEFSLEKQLTSAGDMWYACKAKCV